MDKASDNGAVVGDQKRPDFQDFGDELVGWLSEVLDCDGVSDCVELVFELEPFELFGVGWWVVEEILELLRVGGRLDSCTRDLVRGSFPFED